MAMFLPPRVPPSTCQPPCRVRSASTQDLNQLADVLTSSFYPPTGWRRWVYPVLRLGIYEDLRQRFQTAPFNYVCLAAFVGDAQPDRELLVGTVEISSRRSGLLWASPGHPQLYLSNLAVRESCRRQGVARSLLQASEQTALAWGFQELYLHVMENNVKARRLYQQAGYQLHRTETTLLSLLGGQPRRLLLQKPLVRPSAPPNP
jgi:ribosomal protein S18 acetylase RimI-like enzyme